MRPGKGTKSGQFFCGHTTFSSLSVTLHGASHAILNSGLPHCHLYWLLPFLVLGDFGMPSLGRSLKSWQESSESFEYPMRIVVAAKKARERWGQSRTRRMKGKLQICVTELFRRIFCSFGAPFFAAIIPVSPSLILARIREPLEMWGSPVHRVLNFHES